MAVFRVFYRRGSFALAEDCASYDEALAHARALQMRRGVWHVRIEDANGRPMQPDDLYPPWQSLAATAGNTSASLNGSSAR